MLTVLRHAEPGAVSGTMSADGPVLPEFRSQCRIATGRSALALLIERARPSAALMPGYVAEGVIRPFLAAGVPVRFYRLRPDLSPEPEDVIAGIDQAGPRPIVILIHYFGYPAESAGFADRLRAAGGMLLEDCAHALATRTPAGAPLAGAADFALYSLNKFLPVADGAILLSRRPEIDVSLGATRPPLPPEVLAAYAEHLASNTALAACSDPRQAEQLLARSGAAYERYYGFINSDLGPHAQSAASRAVEDAADFTWLAARRHAHARLLHAGLGDIDGVRLLHQRLPAGTAPFAVPVRVAAGQRSRIADRLLRAGVHAAILAEKWDFVPPHEAARFAVERDFLAEHLLLAVGEQLAERDIRQIIQTIKDAVRP